MPELLVETSRLILLVLALAWCAPRVWYPAYLDQPEGTPITARDRILDLIASIVISLAFAGAGVAIIIAEPDSVYLFTLFLFSIGLKSPIPRRLRQAGLIVIPSLWLFLVILLFLTPRTGVGA